MAAKRSTKRSTKKGAAKATAKKAAKKVATKAKKGATKAAAKKSKGPAKAAAKKAPAKKAPAKKAPAKRPAAKKPAAASAAPAAPKAAPVVAGDRYVWVDLVTSDIGAAQSFYKSLLGWGTKDVDVAPPMNKYTMFNFNGEEFGGVVPKQEPNAPSMWMQYVWVNNVDQVTQKAQSLGGRVLMPPMDIPNVGRFSVISDPTGGVVSPMSFLQPPKAPPAQGGLYGPVAWCELNTDDVAKAGAFYSELFGWGRRELPMGPDYTYTMLKAGDRDIGGMGPRPKEMPANAWTTYFAVEDVDAKTEAAKSSGAKLMMGPMDIPNVGRFSLLADPQGATFALFKPLPNMSAPPSA